MALLGRHKLLVAIIVLLVLVVAYTLFNVGGTTDVKPGIG